MLKKLFGMMSVSLFAINAGIEIDENLPELLEAAYDKAWSLVAGSSNLAAKASALNITEKGKKTDPAYAGTFLAPFRRLLQLTAMRASRNSKLTLREKNLVAQVYSWQLNLYYDEKKDVFPVNMRYVTLESGEVKLLQDVRDKLNILTSYEFTNAKEEIEQDALNAIQWRIANCAEYSNILYTMLLEYDPGLPNKIPMEIVVADRAVDHVFLVVNRNQESDINDPRSWGKNSFIVDPWWQLFGLVSKHVDTMIKRAHNIFSFTRLATGYLGEGHSKNWPHGYENLFSSKESFLLLLTPQKQPEENIPFTYDTFEKDLEISAAAILEAINVSGKVINKQAILNLKDIKPWLIGKKPGFPQHLKSKYFSWLLENIWELSKDLARDVIVNILDKLFLDNDIQEWYSNIDDQERVRLFSILFTIGSEKLANTLIDKSESLKNTLEKIGFDFRSRHRWFNQRFRLRSKYLSHLKNFLK